MPNPLDLTTRYSLIYFDKIDALAIYKDNKQIVFEGTSADIELAKDKLANLYLLDKDDLDQSYNQTINELNLLQNKRSEQNNG